MITFIDDALGFATLHFLRSKADAVTALQDLVTWAEAQTGYHLEVLSIKLQYLVLHNKTVELSTLIESS